MNMKHSFTRSTIAPTAILLLAVTFCTAADWPKWRGPDANGISKETAWNPAAVNTPKVLWTKDLGVGHSATSIVKGRLYTMGNKNDQDIVYCFDAKTGNELWTYSYSCKAGNYAGPRATPIFDNSYLYTLSRNGDVYCINASNGKKVWHVNLMTEFGAQNLKWGFSCSPVIVDNMLLLSANAHGIALDKTNGRKIWASPPDKGNYSSPVIMSIGSKKIAAIYGPKAINGVDIKTGNKLWSYTWETSYDINGADPIPFDGKLFISSGYGHGCALLDISGGSPKLLWENKNMKNQFSSSVLIKGHLYGVNGNTGKAQLSCVNANTGTQKWSQPADSEALMAADGKLIVLDKSGNLSIVKASPDGYEEIAKGSVLPKGKAKNWTAPVLANGLIYCRNSTGTLVCIDVSK
jgi:outer membrane protein assembly factor BamB